MRRAGLRAAGRRRCPGAPAASARRRVLQGLPAHAAPGRPRHPAAPLQRGPACRRANGLPGGPPAPLPRRRRRRDRRRSGRVPRRSSNPPRAPSSPTRSSSDRRSRRVHRPHAKRTSVRLGRSVQCNKMTKTAALTTPASASQGQQPAPHPPTPGRPRSQSVVGRDRRGRVAKHTTRSMPRNASSPRAATCLSRRSARFRNDFSALDISERAASKPFAEVAAPLDRASKYYEAFGKALSIIAAASSFEARFRSRQGTSRRRLAAGATWYVV